MYLHLHMQLLQLARGMCLFNLIILKHKLKILKFTKIDLGSTVNVEKTKENMHGFDLKTLFFFSFLVNPLGGFKYTF